MGPALQEAGDALIAVSISRCIFGYPFRKWRAHWLGGHIMSQIVMDVYDWKFVTTSNFLPSKAQVIELV